MTSSTTPAPPTEATAKPDLTGAFTMPAVSPLAGPPPYRYRDCTAVNILFRTDPAALKGLVPAPLHVDPDQPCVLYVGHFEFADFNLPYNEAGLLVPVAREGKPVGSFAVVLYLDTANPIVGGREVYGWPKKDADQIVLEQHEGHLSAQVIRYGIRIIRVTLDPGPRVEPIPQRTPSPIHFLKLIPSIQEGAPPDVLKLNAMVIEPDVITDLRPGRGTLEFGDSPYDGFLARIPVLGIMYSEVIVHDFTLGFGEVVVDYLASGRP